MRMLGRVRLSRGSVEMQTAQSQAIIGTPWEVPDPRMVTFNPRSLIAGDYTGRGRCADESHGGRGRSPEMEGAACRPD